MKIKILILCLFATIQAVAQYDTTIVKHIDSIYIPGFSKYIYEAKVIDSIITIKGDTTIKKMYIKKMPHYKDLIGTPYLIGDVILQITYIKGITTERMLRPPKGNEILVFKKYECLNK